jgi:hypothetical protein
MTAATNNPRPNTLPAPVRTAAEADALARHFVEVLDMLLGVVQQETELVRAGRLGAAAQLAPTKTDLTRLYVADTLRLRANQKELARIAPDMIEALRRRHDEFRALLQMNLTVLATAHAVSEGIVRGVSGELTRKAAPQTYGSSGRATAPSPRAAQPLAVSRSL